MPAPSPSIVSASSPANAPASAGLSRRRFVSLLAATAPLTNGLRAESADEPTSPVSTKWAEGLDRVMKEFMEPRKVPGGSLAVVKDGRLVFAKGYGWANREKEEPVRPDSLFRTASISKPFTAMAVLRLVEAEKLKLDQPMLDFFPEPPHLEEGKEMDARLRQVTIRHLLQHTGGWDRDVSGDPMFKSSFIAEQTGTPAPAGQAAIISYVLGQPLDFAPGERYAYSNFGYCLLGRIIEKLSGQAYDRYVQEAVLAPCGIKHMRLGASKESERAENEVTYYMPDEGRTKSVFPDQEEEVSWPYGGFYFEPMDSHGGWIASAVDLVRLTAALADGAKQPLLPPAFKSLLFEPPAPPASRHENGTLKDNFYTCGWMVRQQDGRFVRYSHNGSLPGTWTILTQRADGVSWAVLFNQRSGDRKLNDFDIDGALNTWFDEVKDYPEGDLW